LIGPIRILGWKQARPRFKSPENKVDNEGKRLGLSVEKKTYYKGSRLVLDYVERALQNGRRVWAGREGRKIRWHAKNRSEQTQNATGDSERARKTACIQE